MISADAPYMSQAAGRLRDMDPMLPEQGPLPAGCMPPLAAGHGHAAGIAVCRHQQVPAGTLGQTWGPKGRFSLAVLLSGDHDGVDPVLDDLLGQWREHLAGLPEAAAADTAAMINWPSRDINGINALLRHGLQALTVVAVRPAGRPAPGHSTACPDGRAASPDAPGLVIREARPADLDDVTELEMGTVRFDGHFGVSFIRPDTEALVRTDAAAGLALEPAWCWLAEQDGRAVGLVHVQPPEQSGWIATMTRPGITVYLQTMFVRPDVRGGGVGAALVRHVHAELDARGVQTTLLHYAQMNPLSAPFWNRMGYRPLWTGWEISPAARLR